MNRRSEPATGSRRPTRSPTSAEDHESEDDSDETDAEADTGSGSGAGNRRRRRRRRRSTGDETPREDDPDNTVVHVREPRLSQANASAGSAAPAVQRGAGRPRLDPAGGQAAAPARLPGLLPAPPADPDRGRVPGPAGVRRAGDGGPAARRPGAGGAARGRHPGRALRVPDRVRFDDRQRLPGQGAERAAVDGGGVRRHRPRPQRGASTPARSTGTPPGSAARPGGSRPRCPAATPSWPRCPRTRSGTRAPG